MTTADQTTVRAFVVLADAKGYPNQELGLFYSAIAATDFMNGLSRGSWGNPRIEPRQIPLGDIHPAQQALFPNLFPQAATK